MDEHMKELEEIKHMENEEEEIQHQYKIHAPTIKSGKGNAKKGYREQYSGKKSLTKFW